MTTGFRNASGVDFDSIFDPYISGTKPAATGYRTSDGVDLNQRYAPLSFGSQAAVTGYRLSNGADVNTLWAKKGTAVYDTPIAINGKTYSSQLTLTNGQSGSATIGFEMTSSTTWRVYRSNSINTTKVTLESGNVPSGSASVKYTWGSYTVGTGYVDAGGATYNQAGSPHSLSSGISASYITATRSFTSGSADRRYAFSVDFYNASGSNISHSECTLIGDVEGSV